MNQRALGILVVFAVAGLLVVGALVLLSQEPQAAPTPTPTPADLPLATVEGQTIGANYWAEQYLLDQVMNRFAGQPQPLPRQTLDRIINEVLALQAYPPQRQPADAEIAGRIDTLKAAWGVDDATLDAHLSAAGLAGDVLTRTLKRLLLVESAQAQIAAEEDPTAWLTRAREKAQIKIDEALFARITPPVALTPTPQE